MTPVLRRTFSSLSLPNYRRYFAGQIVSISGNWVQTVAEMWLILQLTGSGSAVGLTAALQFLPILLLGAWGGVLADRLPKRTLIMTTQSLMAVPALILWGLTLAGVIAPWMVFVLVLTRGLIVAADNPARQSFVGEIVGTDRLVNAVALNSVVVHTSRILGPALAGAVIAFADLATCFLLNALSFGVMVLALRGMDRDALDTPPSRPRAAGEIRSALRYVAATPALRIPLGMMALVGTLAFNFQVLLPLLADATWDGTATTYAALTTAMGVGSVAGALAAGARGRVSERLLVGAAAAFGVVMLLVAAAPTLELQFAALIPLGAVSVTFAAGINSSLQIAVDPHMRGRVLALYSMVFLGSTPIGAPLAGWLADVAGPRAGLVVGAVAALVAAVGAHYAFKRARAAAEAAATVGEDGAAPAPEDAPVGRPPSGSRSADPAHEGRRRGGRLAGRALRRPAPQGADSD